MLPMPGNGLPGPLWGRFEWRSTNVRASAPDTRFGPFTLYFGPKPDQNRLPTLARNRKHQSNPEYEVEVSPHPRPSPPPETSASPGFCWDALAKSRLLGQKEREAGERGPILLPFVRPAVRFHKQLKGSSWVFGSASSLQTETFARGPKVCTPWAELTL